MSSRRRWMLAFIPLLVATGCTLVTDLSGLSGDAPTGELAEASADADRDANPGADLDAGFDSGEAGPRRNSCGALLFGTPVPLTNADFELGCSNGWNTYAANTNEETTLVSHGSISCRICYVGGPDGFIIQQAAPQAAVTGETYEVVGCIRALPDAGPIAPFAAFYAPTGGVQGSAVAAGSSFAPVRASWTVDKSYPTFNAAFRAYPPDGGGTCFLLDDVSLSRLQL